MKNIRVEPVASGHVLLVDVVCDCGNNGLTDEANGKTSLKHEIRVGAGKDKTLICFCGKKYRLHPQGTHIHVFSE